MRLFYIVLSLVALTGIIAFLRNIHWRKSNIAVDLYSQALKMENNGDFAAASEIYTRALTEAQKSRQEKKLKEKIIEKIKVMHSVVHYNNGLHYTIITHEHTT